MCFFFPFFFFFSFFFFFGKRSYVCGFLKTLVLNERYIQHAGLKVLNYSLPQSSSKHSPFPPSHLRRLLGTLARVSFLDMVPSLYNKRSNHKEVAVFTEPFPLCLCISPMRPTLRDRELRELSTISQYL